MTAFEDRLFLTVSNDSKSDIESVRVLGPHRSNATRVVLMRNLNDAGNALIVHQQKQPTSM